MTLAALFFVSCVAVGLVLAGAGAWRDFRKGRR